MPAAAAAGPAHRPPLRWGVSLGIILALHIVAIVALVNLHPSLSPPPPPPAAITIDLPPLPPARPAPPKPVQPVQKQVAQPPPKPIEAPLVPQAPLARHVDVPLPPSRHVQTAQRAVAAAPPQPVSENQPSSAPAAEAPQAAAAPAAPPAAAATPLPAAAAPSNSNAVPSWQGALLAKLERLKRYPSAAQFRRQQGVAYVRVSMDRRGNVVSATIDKSSGVDALDAETVALIHRAAPLPPPPPEVAGDPVVLVVPVQFFLKP